MQLRELREYLSHRDWKIAGEYVDTGFSGAKAGRPALGRLMADAAKRKFDRVAAWKIDRFGRSVLHLNQQLAALTSHGVRFIATSHWPAFFTGVTPPPPNGLRKPVPSVKHRARRPRQPSRRATRHKLTRAGEDAWIQYRLGRPSASVTT